MTKQKEETIEIRIELIKEEITKDGEAQVEDFSFKESLQFTGEEVIEYCKEALSLKESLKEQEVSRRVEDWLSQYKLLPKIEHRLWEMCNCKDCELYNKWLELRQSLKEIK